MVVDSWYTEMDNICWTQFELEKAKEIERNPQGHITFSFPVRGFDFNHFIKLCLEYEKWN